MKIVDVITRRIHYRSNTVRDSEGHGHPGPEHDAVQSMVTIVTDEGLTGDAFGGSPDVIQGLVKPLLLGKDPFYREYLWQMLKERQRLHLGQLSDKVLCAIDLALWDLAGKYANLPVHKLLGATRDKVPAYSSTMCGDDIPGGLDTPEAYAEFALLVHAAGLSGLQAAHLAAAHARRARSQARHRRLRGRARGRRSRRAAHARPLPLLQPRAGALSGP